MPDLACVYALVTPGGTIYFNDGTDDQYYITDISQGLAGAPIRAPEDPVAYGDGGRSYNFWQGARHPLFEGNFFVTSAPLCSPAMVAVWNDMEENLRVVLASIAATTADTGTLTWTPSGQSSRTLIVRNDVELECPPDQNYLVRTFHFGLVADNPNWI